MNAPPVLHHELVRVPGAQPTSWLYLLPGIYGAGRNWGSVMRRWVQERPDWGAVLVDLRGHGASQGFPPPHTLEAAAADLVALSLHLGGEPRAVLGHSFGGKVGLTYARRATGLEQLWMVDSTPSARPPSGSAWNMLGTLRRNAGPFAARRAGVEALEAEGLGRPVAQWMATNLMEVEGAYHWRLDPAVMEALLRDFFDTDAWDVIESESFGFDVHLVKAEESSVLDEEACARVEAAGRQGGRAYLHRVEGGHWVNVDSPDELVRLLGLHL